MKVSKSLAIKCLRTKKIKNLKINNNNYIQYINELNNLFEQHQIECENLNKKING